VCALGRETGYAKSKADFINNLSIALKEANETEYWLDLLVESQCLEKRQILRLFTHLKDNHSSRWLSQDLLSRRG
jgi:four helix bundle protein